MKKFALKRNHIKKSNFCYDFQIKLYHFLNRNNIIYGNNIKINNIIIDIVPRKVIVTYYKTIICNTYIYKYEFKTSITNNTYDLTHICNIDAEKIDLRINREHLQNFIEMSDIFDKILLS